MQFIIGGLQKTSMLDYPDKISAIVFTQGCNFRCGYCHNPSLLEVKNNSIISVDSIFEFLNKRKGKLDAVVITGGEPTLQKDLKAFIYNVKSMGFLVKLDTNGCNNNILSDLINEKLIDYAAMDIKAPLSKYSYITNKLSDTDIIKESINLILNSKIDYEFRTTVVKSQLSFEDFDEIGQLIKGARKYFLQKFEVHSQIYDESLNHQKSYSDEEFKIIINILNKYIKHVQVR